MSILEIAISVIVFLGVFAIVEYATYRIMEREHEKRGIYRLFFMLGWTTLALLHMWVVAPLLNLPPTAVVGLGLGILAIHIGGDLRIPVLKTIGVIGLYPFALVYQFFVILLLIAEGITFVATLITIPQLNFLSGIGPSDPQIQAALGLSRSRALL